MGRLLLGCIAVFIAVAGSGVTAEATAGNGDWGQAGGGPSHSGNAHKQLGIAPSTVAGLHVVWSHDFGGEPYNAAWVSAPAVSDGRVVASARGQVWAFRASDGATLWHHALYDASLPGNLFAPAVVQGLVYVRTPSRLWALDAATGRRLWVRSTAVTVAEQPVVAGGVVYVSSGSGCCNEVRAYNARSGRLLWRRSTGSYTTSAPAVVNGTAYLGSYSNDASNQHRKAYALWAIDAGTGRVAWERHPPLNGTGLPNGVVATPSVVDGVVYDGGLDAYTTGGRELWVNTQPGGGSDTTPTVGEGLVFNEVGAYDQNGPECAYRASTGRLVWCSGDSIYDSSTVTGGVVLIADGGSYLAAYDARTGKTLFEDFRHVIQGQPAVAGGSVYTGGEFRLFAYRP